MSSLPACEKALAWLVVGARGAQKMKEVLKEIEPDVKLDCTGLYCPQPVIRTADQVREMHSGEVLEISATDPGFQIDLPAWCLSHKHECLGLYRDGKIYKGYLRVS